MDFTVVNQPGYSVYKNLENLLQPTTNHLMNNFVQYLVSMVIILSTLCSVTDFGDLFSEHCEPVSLRDCIQALHKMSATQKELLTELCKLV